MIRQVLHACLHVRLWRLLSCSVLVLLLILLSPLAAALAQGPIPEESSFALPPTVPDPQAGELVPPDLLPASSCPAPQRGPFGRDVEILAGPWWGSRDGSRLDQLPGWYPQERLPLGHWFSTYYAKPWSDIAAVARGMEEIVAVWKEGYRGHHGDYGGELVWSTWSASARPGHDGPPGSVSPGGWHHPSTSGDYAHPRKLGLVPDGNPALLSRDPQHWAVFGRKDGCIKVREWNNGALGGWQDLPGICDDPSHPSAASDPAVISKGPQHMAVFYRDGGGRVWFTEWNWGVWREEPLSLSPHLLYLPLAARSSASGSSAAQAAPHSDSASFAWDTTPLSALGSELSVASRNGNHLAVFGVDASNRLWVKEWTNHNQGNWSDTRWTMLMANVALERPAVATRHSNHLAVAARDSRGVPWIIEWSFASGWKAPARLWGTRSAPLTLAATAVDAMSVYSVDVNRIWHKDWNENEGWGHWAQLEGTDWETGQALTAVVRRMDDVMLLGRESGIGNGLYKHFTFQDREFQERPIPAAADMQGYPRGQALAWVDGETLWVGASQAAAGWQANALALSAGVTESLALPDHPWAGWENRVSLAAGDLDFDGDEEAIVATLSPAPTLSLSVLEFKVSPALTLTATSTFTPTSLPGQAIDVNAAIGDLDGDGRQDEVAVAYRTSDGSNAVELLFYEYVTDTQRLAYRGSAIIDVWWHDIEIDIAKLYVRHPDHGPLAGEQLVVASSFGSGQGENYRSQGRIDVYSVTTGLPRWSITRLDRYDPVHAAGTAPAPDTQVHRYRSALATGDLDVDGLEEAAYSFWSAVETVGYDRQGNRQVSSFEPVEALDWQRSLAVGDVDRDGKAEMAMAGHYVESGFGTIIELMDEGRLRTSGELDLWGTVLVGDLDNDSLRSDLTGCKTFTEYSVIAVINGPPRWYAGGTPVQGSLMRYARGTDWEGSVEHGTTTNVGSSLSVGFELEINVPIIGTKIGEVRSSVSQDFMATMGQTYGQQQGVSTVRGYLIEADSTGLVVFNRTDHTCFYYEVYPPAWPESKSQAMYCRPSGRTREDFKPLEDWLNLEESAGGSWVDLGHRSAAGVRTNDVTTYPSSLPVDPYTLKVEWDRSPIFVSSGSTGAYEWGITQMAGATQGSLRSFETNTTVSAGATVGTVTLDTSVTTGFGWEESRSVSWTEELEMGGGVEKFVGDYDCYEMVPYIHHATARTVAGATYPYIEVDYYVPWIGGCSRR